MRDAPSTIDIRIDALVLPEDLAGCQATIVVAFRDELARLVSECGPPFVATGTIEQIERNAHEIRPGASGSEVGVRLARAVYEGLEI